MVLGSRAAGILSLASNSLSAQGGAEAAMNSANIVN